MASGGRSFFSKWFIFMGECLALSLFLCGPLWADTLILKNGKELKGLVVEKHADRVILSTEKGEVPILLKSLKDIRYDDPAQNFMQIGAAFEKENKMPQALAYYEKALEINPELSEAQRAVDGIKNRFLAQITEGPRDEVEKQQMIHEAWSQQRSVQDLIEKKKIEEVKALRAGLGIVLEKKGDWVRLEYVDPKKAAHIAGLRKNDRLAAIDGQSLRYLTAEAVGRLMLSPRFSNFILEFERDCFVKKETAKGRLKDLGFKLKLKYEGVITHSVKEGGSAYLAGIRNKDLVIALDGEATRYMPLKELVRKIEQSEEDRLVFTVRRSVILARR
jgi:C-terminal processing protease CtpA/Prc